MMAAPGAPLSVALLTPPGVGAIATLAISGPAAWPRLRELFRPASGRALPASPCPGKTWFGRLGITSQDEVVLAVKSADPCVVEVHCHGGQHVVRWLRQQIGGESVPAEVVDFLPGPVLSGCDSRALTPLLHAPTLRVAGILLDQFHGAFRRAVQSILGEGLSLVQQSPPQPSAGGGRRDRLRRLASLASLGEHLVEPWNVVIAGAPNAGKSSLVNALAGYERSVVAPIAGTTRDIVRTRLALAGWPVTLSDTAGLRTSTDDLESLGIERARQELARADLVIWLKDSTQEPGADSEFEPAREIPGILVQSKIDLAPIRDARFLGISSTTGAGLEELMAEIVRRLVPVVPEPGEAVPFTPELAAAIRSAERAWHGDLESARQILQQCLDAIDPKS